MVRIGLALVLASLLTACGSERAQPTFFPDENPALLSEWGQFEMTGGTLQPATGVTAYNLNAPLFSDYAAKLRTVWSIAGPATPRSDGTLTFPEGTVITKTFYYGKDGDTVTHVSGEDIAALTLGQSRILETRLLVKRSDGWHAISYVWEEDQSDARLKRTGAVIPLTLASADGTDSFTYLVPNENQCAACHVSDTRSGALHPLGPTLPQLNRGTQLASWQDAGLLPSGAEPPFVQAAWDDQAAALDDRARSYLAANCAHCHNPNGPADTSGLDLSLDATGAAVGLCKPPIAAGSGTGGHRFGINPGEAETSILHHRMASTAPGSMMPELGRSLAHKEGVELIAAWIDGMDGDCS